MPGGRPRMNKELFEGRRDEMYDMYITQNKSLLFLSDHYAKQGLVASTRAYQNRFKEWNFPSKHLKLPDEPSLHERVKELWGKNLTQPQMLETLENEGFAVTYRQLSRLRSKDGLSMRTADPPGKTNTTEEAGEGLAGGEEQQASPAAVEPPVPLELQIARQARQAKLWQESAERLKNRSRRRRTKGWAGLPPDPGLPPRFPSELTLEECRELLHLDKRQYFDIRKIFKEICRTHNVVRKVSCGPGVWPAVKEEFINRCPQLQVIFRTPEAEHYDHNREPMAFDLICMDVTKSLRVATKTITLIDAKNILGLTPDEARDVRTVFDDILKANFFSSKLDIGKEVWDNYKDQWIQQCSRLQREFYALDDSDVWHQKHKALEVMARDVQKRRRDALTKRDTNASNKRKAGDKFDKTPTPKKAKVVKEKVAKAKPQTDPKKSKQKEPLIRDPDWRSPSGRPPWMPTTPPPPDPSTSNPTAQLDAPDQYRIDPDLLLAAALPAYQPEHPTQPQPQMSPLLRPDSPNTPTTALGAATPMYIRPSPSTLQRYPNLPKLWLETLSAPYTLNRLKGVMDRKLARLRITKIEGLADGAGVDTPTDVGVRWEIGDDEEVEGFVRYVKEQGGHGGVNGGGGGGKVVFVVEAE